MEEQRRIVERLNADGTRTRLRMAELKKGDRFELFEEEGGPRVDDQTFTAASDGYWIDPRGFDDPTRPSLNGIAEAFVHPEFVNGGIIVETDDE